MGDQLLGLFGFSQFQVPAQGTTGENSLTDLGALTHWPLTSREMLTPN
jgi:hypothetical protein